MSARDIAGMPKPPFAAEGRKGRLGQGPRDIGKGGGAGFGPFTVVGDSRHRGKRQCRPIARPGPWRDG